MTKLVDITFTKSFSSPVYGNVYEGKKVKGVHKDTAERYVELGYAKIAGNKSESSVKSDKTESSDDKKVAVKAKSESQANVKSDNLSGSKSTPKSKQHR